MEVFRVLIPVLLLMLFVLPREEAKADTAVCKIGNITYSSLEAAFAAEKEKGSGTITMLKDYTISSSTIILSNVDITLDLAGQKIECSDANDRIIWAICEGAKLRLKDSVGKGYYSAKNATSGMIYVLGGTFIMESGLIKGNDNPESFTSGILMIYGNVTINGGEIQANIPLWIIGYDGNSTLTVNGGRFVGVMGSEIYSDVKPELTVDILVV